MNSACGDVACAFHRVMCGGERERPRHNAHKNAHNDIHNWSPPAKAPMGRPWKSLARVRAGGSERRMYEWVYLVRLKGEERSQAAELRHRQATEDGGRVRVRPPACDSGRRACDTR